MKSVSVESWKVAFTLPVVSSVGAVVSFANTIFIPGFPLATQTILWFVSSASSVVPANTPTDEPHKSAKDWMLCGLPFDTSKDSPTTMYSTKEKFCCLSGVTVIPDIAKSNRPAARASKRESNGVITMFIGRPNLSPIAVISSTSKPAGCCVVSLMNS